MWLSTKLQYKLGKISFLFSIFYFLLSTDMHYVSKRNKIVSSLFRPWCYVQISSFITNCVLFNGRKGCNRFRAEDQVNVHHLFRVFRNPRIYIDQQNKKIRGLNQMIQQNENQQADSIFTHSWFMNISKYIGFAFLRNLLNIYDYSIVLRSHYYRLSNVTFAAVASSFDFADRLVFHSISVKSIKSYFE